LSYASGFHGRAAGTLVSAEEDCQGRGESEPRIAGTTVATEFEKAAWRSSVLDLALRLPLPERTGSDRDEPHRPHGFVDRAYLVFFRVQLANHYSPILQADVLESLSPLSGKSLGRRVSGTSPTRSFERAFRERTCLSLDPAEPPRATQCA